MKSGLDIETITRGLLALQRLKQLHSPEQRSNPETNAIALQTDKLALFRDTLTAVSDFMPVTRNSSFSEAFRLGSHYSSTYRDIKLYFHEIGSGSKSGSFTLANLAKTLNVVAPVFSRREKGYMDKLIKIIDILDS